MDTVLSAPAPARVSVSLWRDTLAPKEHGSWSLAFEPLALGLLVVPSWAGGFLALALGAGFFARRPARILRVERRPERWAAALVAITGCGVVACLAFGAAVMLAGAAWLAWLAPLVAAAGVFAWFDLRGEGRDEAAEIAGAAAFGCAPAAFAVLGGWSPLAAIALAALMIGRAVPSVMCVRAFLRAAKTGTRRDAPALIAAVVAVAVAALFHVRGVAPCFALIAAVLFAARTVVLLVARPGWRARSIGMAEALLGIGFVAGLALSWGA